MKIHILATSAIVALAFAGPGSRETGAAVDPAHAITIPGTVIASDSGKLIIRTDDHGHRMPFEVGPGTSEPALRKGAHVSVTYHPLGPTGQAADEVQVIERNAQARSQASFKIVTGPEATRVTTR
jgi:hypothetical protein